MFVAHIDLTGRILAHKNNGQARLKIMISLEFGDRNTNPLAQAAITVLRNKQAIVIGPTPPGTGVISDAWADAPSKSTSPTFPLL